jgi:hypothetical protein
MTKELDNLVSLSAETVTVTGKIQSDTIRVVSVNGK